MNAGRDWKALRRASWPAWLLLAYWGVLAGLGAASLIDHQRLWPAFIVIAAFTILFVRVLMVGVFVNVEGDLKVVDWFRTRHISGSSVREIRVAGYSGFANRFSESRLFGVVEIEMESGKSVPVRATLSLGRRLLSAVSRWQ